MPEPASSRRFRGKTAAERAGERRARLLAAALELIGEEGWPAVTMTEICRRSGLTERYFYESFTDRDALYVGLIEEVAAETRTAVLDALATTPDDPRRRMRAAARALVGVLVADPRKGRIALIEGLGSATVQARRRELLAAFARLLREEARAFYGDAAPRGLRAEVSSIALVGALGELLGRRIDGSLAISDRRLVDEITELALTL
ncbi:MAG: TetR/AcrR family transcriptional regulator [Solirubrobacteraceae bacterium]|nr:TetR/AcrR family transcriptional regulator [Solirubrobacteraceae bacterium]